MRSIPSLSPKRAFTLIELLVVIAIIAILAAILFPVFAQAKAAAKATTALSNVKNLNTGQLIYAGDADDIRVPRRIALTDATGTDEYNWKQLIAPYVKNTDIYRDPTNAISRFLDNQSDPALRAFWGWKTVNLPANLRFPRGYNLANGFVNGAFIDDKATSMTSFDQPAKQLNIVESKVVWPEIGPYYGWGPDVDSDTSWMGASAPKTGTQGLWSSDKFGDKAMVAGFIDGHAKRLAYSAICGASFMRMPAGSTDVDYWGLSSAQQAGYSWADSECPVPAKYR